MRCRLHERVRCAGIPATPASARVIAIEPNPENLRSMRNDARLGSAGIEVVAAAASNLDGLRRFFVLDATTSPTTRGAA
jgi:FkbM family methyltransferase